jgi:hypothetical protein
VRTQPIMPDIDILVSLYQIFEEASSVGENREGFSQVRCPPTTDL